MLLRLESVSKKYQEVVALDSVTLEIEAGEFVAFVGRSGCGKTTLLNLCGAMDFPSSGRVWLDGLCTSQLDDAGLTRVRRTEVGFIFQFFQLMPTLTAAENVELPALLAGTPDARQRASRLLEYVEMGEYAGRFPHQLSGGQMQRVAVARALINGPRLLLADEPIGNLDSTTGQTVLDLLGRVAAEHGTAILMATHSMESTRAASRVVRLRDGRIEP
jgi:putative ABC transport system ATP-binding protein